MEHTEAQANLKAYFNNTLSREQVRAFHAHLKDCERCQASIRLRNVDLLGRKARLEQERLPPAVQSQMARNRDLLVKLLILMALAALVFKLRR